MSLNISVLMGRLCSDPELKTTQNGISVTSFSIAVDRKYQSHGEERKTDFINIVAWRNHAEFISKYFRKGSMIGIEGEIQTRNYQDKNGNNRTAFEVVVSHITFCGSKNENNNSNTESNTNSNNNAGVDIDPENDPLQNFANNINELNEFENINEDDDLPF